MRRIVIAGLVALAAMLGSAGAATASPVAAPAPPPSSASAFPLGGTLSCGSPTRCLAVGANTDASSGESTPFVRAWNGTAWKSVAAPAPKGASFPSLSGVSCRSATSCLVIGSYTTDGGDGASLPYALTWNGTALRLTAALPVPKGGGFESLDAVSCLTAKSCVAVGSSFPAGISESSPTLVETWNGAKWTLRTTSSLGGSFLELSALRCFSATSCIVAGTSFTSTGTEKVLLARWNGKAFTAMKAPTPAGARSVLLLGGLSCGSQRSCVAVGFSMNDAGTAGFGFAEVGNGTSWRAEKMSWPKADTISLLFGVSCRSTTNCVAVGAAGGSQTADAKALFYNGKTWTQQDVPGPGKGKSSVFGGVSCPKANDCVAFGEIGTADGNTATPLAGTWNGKSWKLAFA